jgi:integrase
MPRTLKTVREIEAIKKPGTWRDAGCKNLYLQVSQTPDRPVTKSWLFRFMLNGKAGNMGLGAYPVVSLEEARDAALEARRQVRKGVDPAEAKRAKKAETAAALARAITFREYAEAFIDAHEPTWRNPKHRQQWRNTMASYVYPVMGDTAVPEVTTEQVLQVIAGDWLTKNETLRRIRGRIEKILDAAKTDGLRSGDNPARWAGHLKNKLPHHSRKRRIRHFPALRYAQAPAFMTQLRQRDGVAAAALEFVILCASRTSEACGARWDEIDFGARTWTVPPGRIKGELQHVVPLSDPAIAVLNRMKGGHKTWIFPGYRGRHLGDNAMLVLLDKMGFGHVTTHGMRGTFRTWSGEQTTMPREVVEVCLAHINDDETEDAYLQAEVPGTLYIDKRRALMKAWAAYLAGDGVRAKLVPAAE